VAFFSEEDLAVLGVVIVLVVVVIVVVAAVAVLLAGCEQECMRLFVYIVIHFRNNFSFVLPESTGSWQFGFCRRFLVRLLDLLV